MSELHSRVDVLEKKLIETYNGITEDWKNVGHIRCYDGLLEPIRVLLREIQSVKDCEKRTTEERKDEIYNEFISYAEKKLAGESIY